MAVLDLACLVTVLASLLLFSRSKNINISIRVFLAAICFTLLLMLARGPGWSLWSLALPVGFLFLLGKKEGVVFSGIFLVLAVIIINFISAEMYDMEFRIRYPAAYFLLLSLSWFYESIRKRTERFLAENESRTRIQRDIIIKLNSSNNLPEAVDYLLKKILIINGVDCGGTYQVSANGGLELIAHIGLSENFIKSASYYPPDSPSTILAMKGNPVFQDYRKITVPISETRRKEGIKAIGIIPVKCGGKVVSVFNIASKSEDYFEDKIKSELEATASLIGNIAGRFIAIKELHDISKRNQAILSAVPNIIMEVDLNKVYTWANKAGKQFFGDDVIGKEAAYYFEGKQDTYNQVEPLFTGEIEDTFYIKSWQRRKDGARRLLAWWCRSVRDDDGNITGALSTARDITDNMKMEEELRQAYKMEAVGRLAGGIAHDFNNQLAGISGFAELVRNHSKGDEKLGRYAENIIKTAKRASDIARELLAFARKGKNLTVDLDIHEIIQEVISLLKHSIDKQITIKEFLEADTPIISGDPTQIQNAFLNLALNAADAMPEGGELIFSTIKVINENNAEEKIPQGTYIKTSVTDNGCGMDKHTLKRIFEPFFTTKAKGTGMGLSAVYGIINNHKGIILVDSAPETGTTFDIYLPIISTDPRLPETVEPDEKTPAKTLAILFVDDEKLLCDLAREMLELLGHRVTAFNNSRLGYEYYKDNWKNIDLVIFDMMMPEMSGRELFTSMKETNPEIKAILCSGYSANDTAQEIMKLGVMDFIQKPFTQEILQEAIRNIF